MFITQKVDHILKIMMDCDYASDWFNEYTQMVKIELE
jgi:hypothetical protein